MGILLLLMYGRTEIDSQSIRHIAPLGLYQIAWDDITHIEFDRQGATMVFHGKNKRLVIPGAFLWSGKDKVALLERIDTEVGRRQLPVNEGMWAAYKLSKNTKIR